MLDECLSKNMKDWNGLKNSSQRRFEKVYLQQDQEESGDTADIPGGVAETERSIG